VRDADSIIELGFPVFCRGLCIKGTNKNQPGRVNVPVMIGGVDIHPGDIVVGDRDGLVVVARNEVAEVIRASEERERKEATMRERLKQGATMVELLGLQDTLNRYGLV
jgi:4-hydroxy-4-methyl-2-oxoglutarate aldolase